MVKKTASSPFFFKNCVLAAPEVIFFLCSAMRRTKKNSSSWSLKYEKSGKLAFKISVWVKKSKISFSNQKMRACAIGGEFFSWCTQKMRKWKFFVLVRIRIETKFLKYEKSEKLTFEFLIWVENFTFKFFQKNECLCHRRYFFLDTTERCAKENFLSWLESELKKTCLQSTKKVKKTAVFRLILPFSR